MRKGPSHKYSFKAVDEGGVIYTLHVYIDTGDGESHTEGTTLIRTSGGGSVTDLDNGKYRIDATGKMLQASEPKKK